MLMFTLAISCLPTSNLPWFMDRGAWWAAVYGVTQSRPRLKWLSSSMDLTFQVPMQYCSLALDITSQPVTSATGCCFCFGSNSSFFLDLFLYYSPVAYWALANLGSSSFSVLSFAFSYCSWSSQGRNTEVVCHSLLQWTPFCWNSPPRIVCFGSPYMAWLIVSLS